jgi:hypothetical protein
VIDLKTQLSFFKNLASLFRKKLSDAETKTFLGRAVYLISIGSNDYAIPFTKNSSLLQSISQQELVDMVIGNLTTVIKVRKISTINSTYLLFIFSFLLVTIKRILMC